MPTTVADSDASRLIELLSLVFFVSGAAGLLFETLWYHQAGLTLGNSVWASSLVLAGFMGGLGVGNLLAGMFGHRLRSVVRAYAAIEVFIAISGVSLVYVLPHLTEIFAPIHSAVIDTPWTNPVRFVIAFLLLLLPSTAMGATLPILVSALHRLSPSFGAALGRLYGVNTLGAVAGALLGELFLVAEFGLRGAAFVAAALNLCAAAAAITLLRQIDTVGPGAPEAVDRPGFSRRAMLLVASSFVAGGVLLALENVWFRFILLFAYGSSLGFAVMLAVVLAGIGAGGLVAGRILAWSPGAFKALPALAMITGIVTVLAYVAMIPVTETFPRPFEWSEILAYSTVLMFGSSALSGVLFTMVGAAIHSERGGDPIGTTSALTFANTVGAMAGPLVAGFVLLPELGVERSVQVLALGYGLVSVLVYAGLPVAPPARNRVMVVAVLGLVAATVVLPRGAMDDHFLALRVERYESKLVAMEEGITATLMYLERSKFGEVLDYRLATNAHSMSATVYEGRRYMKMFVYLPVALHPRINDALLISYGVGVTAKALTDTSEIAHIDVVDVSPETLELNRIVYPDPKDHPLNDPRVQVHIEDGRYFLETTQRRYDLITGEPPPPKNAGIVNLYTEEYFRLMRERLREGGMATYWLPVHDLEEADSKAIIKAFCNAFADCSLWNGAGTDWILLGTRGPTSTVTQARFAAQWRENGDALAELGLERPGQLGALFIGDDRYLARVTEGVAPLVDNYPQRLGLGLPSDINTMYFAWLDPKRSQDNFESSATIQRLFPESVRQATLPYFRWQNVISMSEFHRWKDDRERERAVAQILRETPLRTIVVTTLDLNPDELRAARAARAKGMSNAEIQLAVGIGALADRDYAGAVAHFDAAAAPAEGPSRARELSAFAQCLIAGHADCPRD